MSSPSSIQYEEDDRTLRINDLVISDSEVVEFFADRATEDDVKRALRVGVLAIEMAETSRDVDHVEQAVTELTNNFQGHVDEFTDDIEEQLEANSALIEDGLNPSDPGTPTNQLKEDLEDELQDVREKISKEMGRKEAHLRSTHKGGDFEDQLGHIINEYSIGPFDEVERKSNEEGVLEDCKTGDFLITTEEGYRIVVEAKNWTGGLSKTKIKDELDEAIRNREADCGILVSKNAGAAPETHIGSFHEFGPERSYVALSEGEDDQLHPSFFKFAFNWARIRAQQAQTDLASDIDEGWVNDQLDRLKEDIEELQSMRDQAKNIQDTARELESNLNDKEAELLDTLSDIRKEITTS